MKLEFDINGDPDGVKPVYVFIPGDYSPELQLSDFVSDFSPEAVSLVLKSPLPRGDEVKAFAARCLEEVLGLGVKRATLVGLSLIHI